MARTKGWSSFIAFLLGVAGASVFWLYGPYLEDQVSRRVAEALKEQPQAVSPGKVAAVAKAGPTSLPELRYQVITDGKNILLADLKEGRVWRYYHHTREGGFAREDEGFLPIPLHFEGKKYLSARQVADAVDKSLSRSKSEEAETKPQ